MGGDHDALVRPGPAGQAGDHVAALEAAETDPDRGGEGQAAEVHGPESAGARLPPERLQVQAGGGEETAGGLCGEPSLQGQAFGGGRPAGHVVALARRGQDRRPSVSGALGLVDDQGRHGAAADRLLELVGPAGVVGRRPAAELAGHGVAGDGLEVRVVDQEDGDLALQVHALEVVPAPFRRRHPVAHEDHRGLLDRDAVHGQEGDDRDVAARGQHGLALRPRDGVAAIRRQLGADHGHGLGVASALARRLQPEVAEGLLEVGDRQALAGAARGAAGIGVRGQLPGDGRQARRVRAVGGEGGNRRHQGGEKGREQAKARDHARKSRACARGWQAGVRRRRSRVPPRPGPAGPCRRTSRRRRRRSARRTRPGRRPRRCWRRARP